MEYKDLDMHIILNKIKKAKLDFESNVTSLLQNHYSGI